MSGGYCLKIDKQNEPKATILLLQVSLIYHHFNSGKYDRETESIVRFHKHFYTRYF